MLMAIDFLSKRSKLKYPVELEIIIVLFLFASMFLGDIRGFYETFPWWDTMLHTLSGVVLALIALLLVYTLNQRHRESLHLSPFFVALFAFSFAIMLGVLWEIFEFTMDQVFGMNTQITETGVVDTMWDLIVDTLGALIVAIAGYIYLKFGKKGVVGKTMDRFVEENPDRYRHIGEEQEKKSDE